MALILNPILQLRQTFHTSLISHFSAVMAYSNIFLFLINLLIYASFRNILAAPTFTPILPPSYPLALRNPYWSSDLNGTLFPCQHAGLTDPFLQHGY